MNILIIGNGFDLAHGLPTKYTDFLKFIQAYKKYKELCNSGKSADEEWKESLNEEKNQLLYLKDLCENREDLFHELGEMIFENVWINYFNEIYEQQVKMGKDGWIDFESEMSAIIQALDCARKEIMLQIGQGKAIARLQLGLFKTLKPILLTWNKNINSQTGLTMEMIPYVKKILLDSLNKLTRCLEIYLCDYVERFYMSRYKNIIPRLHFVEEIKIDCVLSFNYTEVFRNLYDVEDFVSYDYIHGKADINHSLEDCNLILGIDEYLGENERDHDNEFVQFKKFYQRIYKQTGCKYLSWISEFERAGTYLSPEPGKLYIIGHSLNITDKDILEKLIMTPNMETVIFYHNKDALGDQIASLVELIGENELIKRVHGKSATIFFREMKSGR